MQAEPQTPRTPLLEVSRVHKSFHSSGLLGRRSTVVAARDVSFQIERGEAVALVGESGSGKSTVARLLLRLETPDAGAICLDGEDVLIREPRGASLAYRGRVQMVFQDPFGSLNPAHSVGYHVIRPLLRHHRADSAEARRRALALLQSVGLEPASEFVDRRPDELSGGQRQRVAIARALAVDPDLLVADEPTSMLDVSIRVGILKLLGRLKRERQLGILLITHDLASARYLADRILVLFRGRIVEEGASAALIRAPAHPYTRALLAATADSGEPHGVERAGAKLDDAVGAGCPFAPRCPEALDVCDATDPAPRGVDGRQVRCHLYANGAGATGS